MAAPRGSERSASSAPLRIEEVLCADAYCHPISHLQLRETAISWIVLTGSFAYKIKKPVEFDFIDASTLERRLHYCREEIRLNRRTAPDLYVDVVPITRANGRVRIGNGAGLAIEYAVRMRQFDGREELSALLESAAVSSGEMVAFGELLARFHQGAPRAGDGAPDATREQLEAVLRNIGELTSYTEDVAPFRDLARLADWTHDTARDMEPLFRARERMGFVRECHGDLHCANIVRFQDRLTPFDCIEFDPRLRWIDVMNDVAFLVMDLVSHQRDDLASCMLNRYLEITGDYEGVRLLPFCAVYRALVRAKVDAVAAGQSPSRQTEFRERLRRRVGAALRWMQRPQPTLVLMHGLSGSGKSWLSGRLVEVLPALRLRSDLERKRIARLDATDTAAAATHQGLYRPEMNHRTYARLLDGAEACLQSGFAAIVDATFLSVADRELFRGLASRKGVPLVIVSCTADTPTLRARILERSTERNDPSDADLQVLERQLGERHALTAQERDKTITVDTRDAGALDRVAAACRAR